MNTRIVTSNDTSDTKSKTDKTVWAREKTTMSYRYLRKTPTIQDKKILRLHASVININ